MKITILGCGGAGGVPLIGNNWGACDPAEPRNRRTRVSLLVEEGAVAAQRSAEQSRQEAAVAAQRSAEPSRSDIEEGASPHNPVIPAKAGIPFGLNPQTLLFDTSPDMREQLLRADVKDISAIFYTHAHADHAHGIDNIRSVNWLTGKAMPLYADDKTLTELRALFPYIFDQPPTTNKFTRPTIEPHAFTFGETLSFGSMKVTPFAQEHGSSHSTGYRINDFAYSTDASLLDDKAFEILRGVKVWIVGAVRERPHPTHANIDMALEWIARVAPERAYLTHMNESLDYATLKAKLPAGVEPAYDGLQIDC